MVVSDSEGSSTLSTSTTAIGKVILRHQAQQQASAGKDGVVDRATRERILRRYSGEWDTMSPSSAINHKLQTVCLLDFSLPL